MKTTQIAATLLLCGLVCCRCPSARKSPSTQVISPPRTTATIKVDAERDEAVWKQAFRSPDFEDAKGGKAPHTSLSILCGEQALYLMAYVADVDLRSKEDLIEMKIDGIKMQINPGFSRVPEGVSVAHDVDGTVDNASDEDEEWISEIAIPWRILDGRRVSFRAVRVDGGRNGPPHALAWPKEKEVVLDCTTSEAKR